MSTGSVVHPDIVGRADVLSLCAAAVRRAVEGHGGLLLIAGEPGIGKTTMLQATASMARDGGCAVAWAACPDDAVPAFWPIVRLLAEINNPLAEAAADELVGGDPQLADQNRFVLFDRVASAVRRAAAQQPLVLLLDDLHWADPSSLRLLAFLVKQIRTSPVLVMGCYRDTEVGRDHPLLQLLAEPGTSGETLTLPGLATEDVATLVARAGGEVATVAAGQIREHTGGNPFFVLHVARLLDAEGHFRTRDEMLPLPVGVRAVLERRLARLSQECHDLLAVAAVMGPRFDLTLLAEISGMAPENVADLLRESAAARLTQPAEAGHEFAHALVRATVAAQLSAARTAELHGRIADWLYDRSGDDELRLAALAHHELNAGPERATNRGVDAAEAAGRHAASARAFEQAAEHFNKAIAACTDLERRAQLQVALGDAHLRFGDWEGAAVAFGAAANAARTLQRGDLFAQAVLGIGADTGGFEVRLGDHRQLAMLDEALTRLGPNQPELRSRVLARRSVASTNIAAVAQREAWSAEAVALARATTDARGLAYALSSWCDVQSGPEHVEERLGAAAEMLTAADLTGDRLAALMGRRFRVVALLELGDPALHQEIDRFAEVAEALGEPLYRWYVPLFRGMQALLRGDLEQADEFCTQAAALGADAGSANAEMLSGTQAAAIAFERGQFEELMHVFEASLEEQPWLRDLPIATAMAPLMDLAQGRNERAVEKLHRLARERFALIPVDSEWLSTLSGISMAILRLEEPVSAEAMYDVLLPHAGRMIVDGIAASCLDPVDYLLGGLALVLGRPGQAATHLRAAAEQARRLSAPLLEAHAHHALGTALAVSDRQLAHRLRKESEAVLARAGAAPFLVVHAPPLNGLPVPAETSPRNRTGVFRRDGSSWTLTFDDRTARLPDAKGLHDLRHLLALPGTPVPALALQHAEGPVAPPSSSGVDVLDDQARTAYRQRLGDLDEEIAEAERMADPERSSRAHEERDFLLAELSAAVGLGGRSRRMGDDADRARKAVTMRIRNAVARISREHPTLGRHLDLAVRTGTVCSYEPEEPVEWTV